MSAKKKAPGTLRSALLTTLRMLGGITARGIGIRLDISTKSAARLLVDAEKAGLVRQRVLGKEIVWYLCPSEQEVCR